MEVIQECLYTLVAGVVATLLTATFGLYPLCVSEFFEVEGKVAGAYLQRSRDFASRRAVRSLAHHELEQENPF